MHNKHGSRTAHRHARSSSVRPLRHGERIHQWHECSTSSILQRSSVGSRCETSALSTSRRTHQCAPVRGGLPPASTLYAQNSASAALAAVVSAPTQGATAPAPAPSANAARVASQPWYATPAAHAAGACVSVCVCVCVCVRVCVCFVCAFMCVFLCVHVYVCAYMCVYEYLCVCTSQGG